MPKNHEEISVKKICTNYKQIFVQNSQMETFSKRYGAFLKDAHN